jgi:hypothetical protein
MPDLIKCPKCQTWNEDRDYCLNCNELLNYKIQRALEIEAKRVAEENRPKSDLDLFLERIKNSDKPSEKVLHYLLQSLWFLVLGFASLCVLFLAAGPG